MFEDLSSGQLSYNGVTFPSSTSSELRIQPVPDASGRTAKYSVFTITARAEWTAGPGQDTSSWEQEIQAMRRALTHFGGALTYNNKGIGQLNVNVGTSGSRDVVWGPKPQELAFRLLGAGRAFAMTWQVQVAIPDCAQAMFAGKLMELCWSASYAVDYAGYTTRTISGFLAIPNNRLGNGRQLADSPDNYIALIAPPLIPGFRRTFGPRKIDESKTRLDFTFVDTEMGLNFPPEWVVNIRASHTVQSTSRGLSSWSATISAEYELAKAAPDAWSPWKHFIGVLVKDRVDAIAAAVGSGGSGANGIIPIGLSLGEPEIYGRRKASFSLSFTFIRPLKEIADATGLWRPVPGSDWSKWTTSLAGSAFGPFGYAGMQLSPADDRITDLCDVGLVPRIGSPGGSAGSRQPKKLGESEAQRLIKTIAPTPTEEKSWIDWDCSLRLENDSGTGTVTTLPDTVPGPQSALWGPGTNFTSSSDYLKNVLELATKKGSDGGTGTSSSGGSQIKATDAKSQATRRAKPVCIAYLEGHAVRAHFPIPNPCLTEINGVECVEANRLDHGEGFVQSAPFNAGSGPIYKATWRLRYVLAAIPEGPCPPPQSPIIAPKNQ